MAGSLEEKMRKEMRRLERAKQKLLSAIAVYVDPVLRDATIALHTSMTKTRKCKEHIAALKEYADICCEVEDVLRHKCGDSSSSTVDIAEVSPKRVSNYVLRGLEIINPSLEGSQSGASSNDSVNEITDIQAPPNRDADDSDSDQSSVVTVLQQSVDPYSTQQCSTGKDTGQVTATTQKTLDESVKDAIDVLEELDSRLESHNGSDSSSQPDQCLDKNPQSDQDEITDVQIDQTLTGEKGQMLLEARFQFATSLPIGLDELFRSADDVLSPVSKLDGTWALIGNKAEWNLDDSLNCFFPQQAGFYAVGVHWQQKGVGILNVSIGTRDKPSRKMTQFPVFSHENRTQEDGEIGRMRFKCFLSSDIGLWVSICRLTFNPKLSSFTITCQRCPSMEMNVESTEKNWHMSISSNLPFYE